MRRRAQFHKRVGASAVALAKEACLYCSTTRTDWSSLTNCLLVAFRSKIINQKRTVSRQDCLLQKGRTFATMILVVHHLFDAYCKIHPTSPANHTRKIIRAIVAVTFLSAFFAIGQYAYRSRSIGSERSSGFVSNALPTQIPLPDPFDVLAPTAQSNKPDPRPYDDDNSWHAREWIEEELGAVSSAPLLGAIVISLSVVGLTSLSRAAVASFGHKNRRQGTIQRERKERS